MPAGKALFERDTIHMETSGIHTVKPLSVTFPKGRLTVVTGCFRLRQDNHGS